MLTAEEEAILAAIARSRGAAWAEEHAELILDQARELGELFASTTAA